MTEILDPTFDPAFESELNTLLHEHGASITVVPDPIGVSAALSRADRMRTIGRASMVAAVAGCVLAGSVFLRDGGSRESLDISPADAPTEARRALPLDELTEPIDEPEPIVTSVVTTILDPALTATDPTPTPSTTAAPPSPAHPASAAPATATTEAPASPTTHAPPTTQVASVGFSAGSRYGSCGEDPPYDEYSGTANPGSVVTITSPWSSPVSVTAGDQGHWSATVFFPAAPVGEPFTVTVSSPQGNQQLPFTRTG